MKKFKLLNLKSLIPQSNVSKPRHSATRLAARLTQAPYDDYEEEPTTKLSTAFLVVFVLHVVAVAGIYAFHSIKAKRREADGTAATVLAAKAKASGGTEPSAKMQPTTAAPAAPVAASGGGAPVVAAAVAGGAIGAALAHGKAVAAAPLEKPQPAAQAAVGPSAVIAQAAVPAKTGAVPAGSPPKAGAAQATAGKPLVAGAGEVSSKTYKVLEGDNPVKIAKKMRVNYDELLKVNGIEDPRKLRVGQVLKLPVSKHAGNN